MRTIGVLIAGLMFLAFGALAGEVITNDTGEDATGLRVAFSQPVLITAFGDILTSVDPQMLSFEFVFSGGTVKPWESQWFNYAPATASVMETEWLTVASSDADTYPAITSASAPSVSSVNWEEVPKISTYPRDVSVEYHCNGDEDLANAQFWSRSGSEVEAIRLSMTDSSLLLGVELYEGNSLDYYDYVISFYLPSRDWISLRMTPSQDRLEVSFFQQSGDDVLIYIAEGSGYGEAADAFYAVIPLAAVLDYASQAELCDVSIGFNLLRVEGNRRELFFFSSPTRDTRFFARIPSKTYDEIMAEIAQYPEDDEPVYIPAEDEEIWLTDLEGHADIYDNDSIKINYADSFDQSRITKIEVYRNGIKMDFLPDMIGSLTNDQMKTFDGNLLENTPASSHTDHAIWGYEYLLDFVSKEPAESPVHRKITVLSPALPKFNTPYAYIGTNWESRSADAGLTDDEIGALLRELKNSGFVGISVNVNCYIETVYSSDVFILTKPDGVTSLWSRTASDEEIARILSLAAEQDLETELRMQLYVSHEWTSVHGGYSGEVDPENPGRFFMSYGDLALHYAALAEAYGAVLFTPFTEMDAIEKYTDEVRQFYGGLDSVFSGAFSFEEGTHHFLLDSAGYNLECRFENSVGRFWDWTDTAGEPLTVEWSCWTPTLETQADQRLSVLVERMVEFWAPALGFYREHYPDNRIRFGEIGVYTMDGICLGNDYYSALQDASSSYQFGIIDEQEVADIWAAYLIASHYMELDGLTAWTFLPSRNWEEIYKIQPASSQHFGAVASGISPPLAVISSLLGGEWEGIYVSERVEESVVVLSVGTLDYPGAVEVVAYLDWETVPLSETTSWGLRGCDVKSVKASISSDELFIELELYENGLTSGNFGAYAVVLLLASGDRVAIGMIPGDRSVVLEYDNQISNQYVDTISGSAVAVSPQTMSVSIPINALSSVVSREALCGATFSLVLEAFPDSHHEIFWFPGKAAVDCQK